MLGLDLLIELDFTIWLNTVSKVLLFSIYYTLHQLWKDWC